MILNIAIAIAAGILSLFTVSVIVRVMGGGSTATLGLQAVVTMSIATALFHLSFVGIYVAVFVGVMPFILRVFAMFWFYYIGRKVLAGDYGEESKWAAEIVESGDTEFVEACKELTEMELRESGIVATDRSEMREIVVEKAEDENES